MAVVQQGNAPAAQALDLPTWDDVEAAKKNQAAADKKVTEIEGLIADGEKELDRRRNMHAGELAELKVAEEALAVASDKAHTLNTEAEASKIKAQEAADQASVIVAQMYRSGGVDRSMELFLDSDASTADALLERMASMSKATERNSKLSEEAEQTANTASSLSKQAEAAEAEREVLRQEQKVKEESAAAAVTQQGVLVAEQEAQQRDLEVKLEALKDKTSKTVDGYKERLRIEEEQRIAEAKRLAEEAAERQRLAEEAERERQAAEAAEQARLDELERRRIEDGLTATPAPEAPGEAPAPPAETPAAPAPSAPPPPNTSNGWTIPTSGYYVSEGYRSPGRWDHTGTDLATACGTPIVSAAEGTVALTYWEEGAGGNMVTVNHPNGWQTRYAHMIQWAAVAPGQPVGAGQVLGYVGSTGASTGCHLHFEMRPNQDNGWYGFVNPQDYIAL
ncbi:murein DD-endopeptidase MepM/ murein hydrolase activator NlpD [Leucobacter exalbidus]|uniref:Murein DD-endopeptidase MepM/ murein hydrolase activator NlpD n=1 Tax=Leucobacter exalbidus TaxID=662960 RepID=A0A940T3I3_9MICO|nr:M23 family metallopeptidase [Leucobacter exalbidus]MBP1325784.1 murein DD-endopeptidase MepM/ murein hydrolase activator NlpD [Leucobacter exalbidus]